MTWNMVAHWKRGKNSSQAEAAHRSECEHHRETLSWKQAQLSEQAARCLFLSLSLSLSLSLFHFFPIESIETTNFFSNTAQHNGGTAAATAAVAFLPKSKKTVSNEITFSLSLFSLVQSLHTLSIFLYFFLLVQILLNLVREQQFCVCVFAKSRHLVSKVDNKFLKWTKIKNLRFDK